MQTARQALQTVRDLDAKSPGIFGHDFGDQVTACEVSDLGDSAKLTLEGKDVAATQSAVVHRGLVDAGARLLYCSVLMVIAVGLLP